MERTGTKSVDIWSIITDIERNMSPHLTDALSQLAALREELAETNRLLGSVRQDWFDMKSQRDSYEQRLADAERRNAVLVNLLRETCGHYSVLTGIILTLSREDQLTSEPMRKSAYAACDHGKKINAALTQPEEAKS
jgi:chromosome segregation ATPase